jgi:hypothetical protein
MKGLNGRFFAGRTLSAGFVVDAVYTSLFGGLSTLLEAQEQGKQEPHCHSGRRNLTTKVRRTTAMGRLATNN